MITFIENHDGLNRFRVSGVTERRNRLAQGLVMTLPGIPCLYYGTEHALLDDGGKVGEDGETGRQMLYPRRDGPASAEVRNSRAFKEISALAALRERLPVLRSGAVVPLWVDNGSGSEDDGVFAFGRASEDGEQLAVVVINASDESRLTGVADFSMRLPSWLKTEGKVLRPALVIGTGVVPEEAEFPATGPLRLPAPVSSLVVYEMTKAE